MSASKQRLVVADEMTRLSKLFRDIGEISIVRSPNCTNCGTRSGKGNGQPGNCPRQSGAARHWRGAAMVDNQVCVCR
jgi:predicted Zn-ribbon and HTH transcriptional regulator